MKPAMVDALIAGGVRLARRSPGAIRLVTRFDGLDEDVERFVALVREVAGE